MRVSSTVHFPLLPSPSQSAQYHFFQCKTPATTIQNRILKSVITSRATWMSMQQNNKSSQHITYLMDESSPNKSLALASISLNRRPWLVRLPLSPRGSDATAAAGTPPRASTSHCTSCCTDYSWGRQRRNRTKRCPEGPSRRRGKQGWR